MKRQITNEIHASEETSLKPNYNIQLNIFVS